MGRATSLEELFMAVSAGDARCEREMGAWRFAIRSAPESSTDRRAAKKNEAHAVSEDTGLIGWAVSHGEVSSSSDAESDPRRDPILDARVGGGAARTALVVPFEGEHNADGGGRDLQQASRPSVQRRRSELLSSSARTRRPRFGCSYRAKGASAGAT